MPAERFGREESSAQLEFWFTNLLFANDERASVCKFRSLLVSMAIVVVVVMIAIMNSFSVSFRQRQQKQAGSEMKAAQLGKKKALNPGFWPE